MQPDAVLRTLAAELGRELDDVVDAMFERMRRDVPGFDTLERPELARALWEETRSLLAGVIAGLDGTGAAPLEAPAESRHVVRMAADLAIPVAPITAAYRVGQSVLEEWMFAAVGRVAAGDVARTHALTAAHRFLFAYVEAVVPLVEQQYRRDRYGAARSADQRRLQLVRRILAGDPVPVTALAYPLEDMHHIGVLVEGEDRHGAPELVPAGDVVAALWVPAAAGTWWGWVATVERPTLEVPAGPARPTGVGEPMRGRAGFRRTHDQARRAFAVAQRTRGVARFGHVGIEALSLADAPGAHELVIAVLGPLAGGDARTATLRATLEAYLASGQNAAAAGAVLGVSDRTVANRVRSAEDHLGFAVVSRSVDLGAALRVHRLLSAAPRRSEPEDAGPR